MFKLNFTKPLYQEVLHEFKEKYRSRGFLHDLLSTNPQHDLEYFFFREGKIEIQPLVMKVSYVCFEKKHNPLQILIVQFHVTFPNGDHSPLLVILHLKSKLKNGSW
jgi:hypothetical protein